MNGFVFDGWEFDQATHTARFKYAFEDTDQKFTETVTFASSGDSYDKDALVRALDLAHLLIGTSYYKAFPTTDISFSANGIDEWQAIFLNKVYQEGLSQFAYENALTRKDLAQFSATQSVQEAVPYEGSGVLCLQSGGKDSLLLASLLLKKNTDFESLYISSTESYPAVLDDIGQPVRVIQRHIDKDALRNATKHGAKNGHVPVTYIVLAISLVQAILDGKNTVLAAIGREGEESHAWIDDLPVNHQWSKTWEAEQLFAEYVERYVSPDIRVGSPLRGYSELKIAELFAQHAWEKFGHSFSSCNRANYQQGHDNTQLSWCGDCPKCANSYLLFAPFVSQDELSQVFGGDLFTKESLQEIFKGLMGIDGVMKPFECVGETDELRLAYHSACENGYEPLPFEVPPSSFSKDLETAAQSWTHEMLQ